MILSIGPYGTIFSEISIKTQNFPFTKMHLKVSSAKWQPFFPVGDELNKDSMKIREIWQQNVFLMTSYHGNACHFTGLQWGDFPGHRWNPTITGGSPHKEPTSNGSWRQGIKGEMTCTGYVALVWNIIYRIMTIIVIIIIMIMIMIIIIMIIIMIIIIIIKRWCWW